MPKKTSNTQSSTTGSSFSDDEREAMKERALELKANKGDGEALIMAKISAMKEPDKSMAMKLHKLITAAAPQLTPKTWYGMPAYANKEGKVVCFFQESAKFKTRYATLGFSDSANLDQGDMWPVTFALKKITNEEEKKILELIKIALR